MRLLRGVYPVVPEGLAMTSYGGPIYAKNFWDTILEPCVIFPEWRGRGRIKNLIKS
jgi:hypothetical protein